LQDFSGGPDVDLFGLNQHRALPAAPSAVYFRGDWGCFATPFTGAIRVKAGRAPPVAQREHEQRCAQLLDLGLKFPNLAVRVSEELAQQARFFRTGLTEHRYTPPREAIVSGKHRLCPQSD
jgi:hypothetical protein